jgi:gliding motility-associated-like protein
MVTGVTYGDTVGITITDACGRSVHVSNTLADLNVLTSFVVQSDSCQLKYYAAFLLVADSTQHNVHTTFWPDPVTVVVSDSATGAILDTLVTNDPVNHSSQYVYSAAVSAGHTYIVKIIDGCGNLYLHTYEWPPTPQPNTYQTLIHQTCRDSTASLEIQWQNTFSSVPTITLISGPGSIGSTKPSYVYHDTIIYPQSHLATSISNGYFIELTNLAVGTYHYRVSDSCGNSITDSFTIHTQDLQNSHYSVSYKTGCPGKNIIIVGSDNIASAYITNSSGTRQLLSSPTDTIINLNSGTYALSFVYSQTTYQIPVNQNTVCQTILDTVIIPAYQAPQIIYADEIECHGTLYITFYPDSTKGVAPYGFQIISGPQTVGFQTSNQMVLTQVGMYVARITDSCGYASTYSFSVDTLSFPDIVRTGAVCVGGSANLANPHSPYAIYNWVLPNGNTYTGDSLTINPIVQASYGIYQIQKIVSVNGCRDTFSGIYVFSGNNITQTSASICVGQSVLFGGISRTAVGVYYDTIPTAACDSIVELNLTIRGPLYDSVVQAICPGQSVSVGSHTYITTGIYRDTIATVGCDSTHVLNLTVNPYRLGAMSVTICPGQTFLLGSTILSSAGTYYDTVPTTGCDSIIALTLSIRGPLYDSSALSICAGHSVTVGTHTYTATGIYYDTIATAGCDSIHVLNLTVNPYKRSALSAGICPGQSYGFGAGSVSSAGTYYDTIPTTGCDSIVTLTLSVGINGYDSVVQSVCMGHSVTVGAHAYSTTGIYRDTFSTPACDSFFVLNLIVSDYIRASESPYICPGASFSAGTRSYTATGAYMDTVTTTSGCDSIITTHLTVISPTQILHTVSGTCYVLYLSQIFTSDTSLVDTIPSTLGCDSIYETTQIRIQPLTVRVIDNSVCIYTGQSYAIGGHAETIAGLYSDTVRTTLGSCDSIILNTNLKVITPQYIHRRIDSCYTATIGGITYDRDTLVVDTIVSSCGLDSLIALDTVHLYDPSIQISAARQLPIIAGEPTQLMITPVGNYQNIIWSPNYAINNIYAATPTVSPYVDTTYFVTVENANHCLISAQILITVTGADLPDFLLPTAFSPNGDNLNDIFHPIIKPGATVDVLYFQIFDRWGQLVFDGTGATGWDGKYKNVGQPMGVYVYYISAKVTSGKTISQSGNVTLLR